MGTISSAADLTAVKVFVQVATSGGFTAAAQALGLPKSTVSRRVAELEAHLGVRLLQRTTRRVSLTEAGAAYHGRAERALLELQEAEAAVTAARDKPTGVLRVTCPVDFGHDFMPGLAAAYCEKYPEVGLVIDIDNRRVDLVAEGYDLALRASAHLDDSSLIARKLVSTEHFLFASKRYLQRHGVPKAPADLARHELLLFRRDQMNVRLRLHRGDELAEVEMKGRISASDLGFLRGCALQGLGIATLPAVDVRGDVATGRLRRVLPEYRLGTSAMHAVYPSSRHLSPKVRAFIELAEEQLRASQVICDRAEGRSKLTRTPRSP
jgi:DNA-binding transcriptional LysR family regulator